jgi:nucleoside-diphosphate-sugar epimerase
MKKVLLIGSSGYIGSRLGPYLKDIGHSVGGVDIGWYGQRGVSAVEQDYRNLPADIVKEADVVILLAGHSSVKMSGGDIQSPWKNNVSNFVDLVGKMNRWQQLIYVSSGSVYGNGNGDIFSPINNYDITKYVLDLEARRFINDGYRILGLRFGTVNGYAPYVRDELMINAMMINAQEYKQISINNAYIRRPILATSDICGAMEAMIESPIPRSGIYDLCSFNDRVIDIAEAVAYNTGAKIITTPDRQGVYDFIISNEKFSREFDYKFTSTRDTIIEELASNTYEHGNRNEVKDYE